MESNASIVSRMPNILSPSASFSGTPCQKLRAVAIPASMDFESGLHGRDIVPSSRISKPRRDLCFAFRNSRMHVLVTLEMLQQYAHAGAVGGQHHGLDVWRIRDAAVDTVPCHAHELCAGVQLAQVCIAPAGVARPGREKGPAQRGVHQYEAVVGSREGDVCGEDFVEAAEIVAFVFAADDADVGGERRWELYGVGIVHHENEVGFGV